MKAEQKGHNLNYLNAACASILFVAAFLMSCQQDKDESNRVTLYPVIQSQIESAVETRALPANTYQEYTGTNRQTIYAYARAYAGNAQEPNVSGNFAPASGNKWSSHLEVETGKSYYLWAHTRMPGSSSVSMNYNSGVLTITGLDVISDSDPLLCTASSDIAANLVEGTFNIGEIPANTDPENPPTVALAMKHLYARATVSFKLDPDYNSLRTVKITRATISTTQGGTYAGSHQYSFGEMSLTLASNNPSGTQQQMELIGGSTQLVDYDQGSTTEVTLDTNDYQDFGWFTFLSTGTTVPSLSLTVEYNVYDSEGGAMRLVGNAEHLTATNGNILKGISNVSGGNDYKIRIIVKPTYLYQLSDNDVSFELSIQD